MMHRTQQMPAPGQAQAPAPREPPGDAAAAVGARFRRLADDEWAWRLREFPRLASRAGDRRFDDRLERMDRASRADRLQHQKASLAALGALDVAALSSADRVDHAVLLHQLQLEHDEAALGGELMPIDADQSFYAYLTELWREQPLDSADDVERHLSRLAAIATYFDDHIELLQEAVERGVMPPAVVLAGREACLRPVAAATRGEDTDFHRALAPQWARWPDLAARAARLIEAQVIPAYRRLLEYLRRDYLPLGRAGLAARELPDGEAFYAARLRGFTTQALTPRQVHEIGLAEVERIGAEMRDLQRECGHAGSPAGFVEALRRDPRHYARDAEELLARASWIAKRVDAVLPRYFGRLPRQPFGVQPVPEALAAHYTSGRYVGAAPGGRQSAIYWVNTHALESRALFSLPALTLHEAMPGHHLQFALMAEDESLAPFRRFDHSLSAHTEGWALYAEFLGLEMGLYRTPFEAYGRASYEMWRACRLVVDTGVHMFGWSREQAQRMLREHTALSAHEIVNEVDRYIGWPGQALSYKMGEIRLRALRRGLESRAAAAGQDFDLRDFHDKVLSLGPMPLPVLQQVLGGADR
jgi:uncharacterized protein (DUF885 family)